MNQMNMNFNGFMMNNMIQHHMNQQKLHQQQQPLQPQECTIIILQTSSDSNSTESNHIRITMPFDPNSTAFQFKTEIHKFLSTSKQYKDNLHHQPQYYSELGITNDALSPHDIFEVKTKPLQKKKIL